MKNKAPTSVKAPALRSKPQRSIISILWKFTWRILALAAVLSIFWVAALRWVDPPLTSLMIKRSWQKAETVSDWTLLRPKWREYHTVSPLFFKAVVAAEDQKFMSHYGFDWSAIQTAARWNAKHRKTRGASTISQQVAKNVFLWEGRSWLRKGLEVWFTVWIETLWSKKRILEVYANVAELGPWTFGVEQASRKHFGVDSKRLSAQQAALLAAVLPKPRSFKAQNPSLFYRHKQRVVLKYLYSQQIPKSSR